MIHGYAKHLGLRSDLVSRSVHCANRPVMILSILISSYLCHCRQNQTWETSHAHLLWWTLCSIDSSTTAECRLHCRSCNWLNGPKERQMYLKLMNSIQSVQGADLTLETYCELATQFQSRTLPRTTWTHFEPTTWCTGCQAWPAKWHVSVNSEVSKCQSVIFRTSPAGSVGSFFPYTLDTVLTITLNFCWKKVRSDGL